MCTHTPRTLSESAVWSAVLTPVFPSGEWDDSIATSGLLGGSDKKSTLWESWALQRHGCDFGTEGQEFLRAPEADVLRGQRPDGPQASLSPGTRPWISLARPGEAHSPAESWVEAPLQQGPRLRPVPPVTDWPLSKSISFEVRPACGSPQPTRSWCGPLVVKTKPDPLWAPPL